MRSTDEMPPPAAARPAAARLDAVDALRGVAMVWMTVFHFCFDLSHFGYWPQEFRVDPFWTVQRTMIVSLFLLCAGFGQAIAWQQGVAWPRFWRRWGQIVACAVLVTLGSAWMFPRSFIYFGVLHGMAAMLLITRLTSGAGPWLWPMGLLALAAPWGAQWLLAGPWHAWASVFDSRTLNWLGLVSRKPFTEDYVPLFPWLGVMWWGMAAGQWILGRRPTMLAAPLPAPGRALAWLGRWSLSYYMLHQPVMIGGLMAVGWWLG